MTATADDDHVLVVGALSSEEAVALAHSLHRASARRSEAFLRTLTPLGIPVMLLESELFGHVVGGFPGAVRDFVGALERAGAGTLFIERIDVWPRRLVKRLERALDSGRCQRIGQTATSYAVTCRVIGASPGPCTVDGLHLLAASSRLVS